MFDLIFISSMFFFIGVLIFFSYYEIENVHKITYANRLIWVIILGLFIVSIMITGKYSPDFLPYSAWFQSHEKLDFFELENYAKDPAFFVLSKLILKLDVGFIWLHGLFLIIIFFSLFKILNHKCFECYQFLALLIFFGMFYIIHEIIQIRIAVAICLGMLSFLFLYDDKKILCLLFFMLGISFHLAGVFLLVPIAFYYITKWPRFTFFAAISLFIVCILVFHFQIEYQGIIHYLPNILLKRSKVYLQGTYSIRIVEIFTTYNMVKILFFCFFLVFYENMNRIVRVTALVAIFNFVVLLIFKNNDSIALRYTQYFSLFDILFYVTVLRSFSIYKSYYRQIRLFAVTMFSVGGVVWLRSTLLILNDFDYLK